MEFDDAAPPPESAGENEIRFLLEEQVGFALRRAYKRVTDIFGEVMAEFAVTPTQFAVLAKLHELGPISQNQLGRFTAMDPSTVLGVVRRLSRRGLVEPSADEADARLVMISLTEQGRFMARRMCAVAGEVSRRALAPLTPDETATFLMLLRKLG